MNLSDVGSGWYKSVQTRPDHVAFWVGSGEGELGAELSLDHALQDLESGAAGVDQRVPHTGEGSGASSLVGAWQPA